MPTALRGAPMTYYHRSKEAAKAAADHLQEWWSVDAQLEPGNGWVPVLRPRSMDVLRYPLYDLLDRFVIDWGKCQLSRRHSSHKALPTTVAKKPVPKPAAPPKAPPPPPPPPAPK